MSQIIPINIPTFIGDQNYGANRVLPRLLFYNGLLDCEEYYIESGSLTNSGIPKLQTAFPYFDNYNVVSGSFPTINSDSLLFNNEAAAYGQVPTGSLYTTYWETYVNLLYNPRTRLFYCEAIIPLADYYKMELNDIVEWRGNYYHLRAINEYNLKNGECKIQLLGPLEPPVISNLLPEKDCGFNFTSAFVETACPYSVGDLAEGGIIAYILQPGDNGYDANQQKGFVATISDISTGAEWGCQGTNITTFAGIGFGNQNTINIMAACATPGIAARLCGDLVEGGYSDWYLPSIAELQKICANRVAIGGFAAEGYWSSTQNGLTLGTSVTFSSGCSITIPAKSSIRRVRAIRSFTCPSTLTTTTTTTAPTTTTTTLACNTNSGSIYYCGLSGSVPMGCSSSTYNPIFSNYACGATLSSSVYYNGGIENGTLLYNVQCPSSLCGDAFQHVLTYPTVPQSGWFFMDGYYFILTGSCGNEIFGRGTCPAPSTTTTTTTAAPSIAWRAVGCCDSASYYVGWSYTVSPADNATLYNPNVGQCMTIVENVASQSVSFSINTAGEWLGFVYGYPEPGINQCERCITLQPAPCPSTTTTTTTSTTSTTSTTTGAPVEYQIDNGASGDSASACSGATTTSIVYASPGNTVPIVGMFLYTNTGLTTPFVGSTGWRKLTGPLDTYAVEINTSGEITNYVTC